MSDQIHMLIQLPYLSQLLHVTVTSGSVEMEDVSLAFISVTFTLTVLTNQMNTKDVPVSDHACLPPCLSA